MSSKTELSTYRDHYRNPAGKNATKKKPRTQKVQQFDQENAGNCVTRADLTELKSLSKPPQAIKELLTCILIVMGSKDTSWKAAKALLGNTVGLIQKLKSFDAQSITPEMLAKVKSHMSTCTSVQPEDLHHVGRAAVSLALWLKHSLALAQR